MWLRSGLGGGLYGAMVLPCWTVASRKGTGMASNEAEATRQALYAAIQDVAERAKNQNTGVAAAALRDMSLAWRALYGGTQPGSIIIDK